VKQWVLIISFIVIAGCASAPPPDGAEPVSTPVASDQAQDAERLVLYEGEALTLDELAGALDGESVSAHVTLSVAPGVPYPDTVELVDVLLAAGFADIGMVEAAEIVGADWAIVISG